MNKLSFSKTLAATLFLWFVLCQSTIQAQDTDQIQPQYDETVLRFMSVLFTRENELDPVFEEIEQNWENGYVPMTLETIHLERRRYVWQRLLKILETKSGQSFGQDTDAWFHWLWSQDENYHSSYAEFKSALYALIDKRFKEYFSGEHDTLIRLDEIRWGGVAQDGIPPLRSPKMINASEADYLEDDNVVFGVIINGDARAYPKRILAWHEMFVDKVGGIDFAGVYCTLCGTVILYKTLHNGTLHAMGTSGFLYRSNKLMYDKATQSLWSTMRGIPVVGPLVGKDIQLERSFLVTTTWGEWRKRHPNTTVLSLDTGHSRDYGEGVAYQRYFATDELMFTVPEIDTRLKNKDEVLALWFTDNPDEPLAISADYLSKNPVHHDQIGDTRFVVLTDTSGANRVYESGALRFEKFDGDNEVTDNNRNKWKLEEDNLISNDDQQLKRLPAHRAFWFGWFSAFNNTRLVQ